MTFSSRIHYNNIVKPSQPIQSIMRAFLYKVSVNKLWCLKHSRRTLYVYRRTLFVTINCRAARRMSGVIICIYTVTKKLLNMASLTLEQMSKRDTQDYIFTSLQILAISLFMIFLLLQYFIYLHISWTLKNIIIIL